jgi:hypothetical protein
MSAGALDHSQTLDSAGRATADMTRLLDSFFAGLAGAS